MVATFNQLAPILGARLADVQSTVSALSGAFLAQGTQTDNVLIAAIATVRVECPPFRPIHEEGTDEYFRIHYDITGNPHKAIELGNTEPGDGIKFSGRGLIQLTGRSNYRRYGAMIGVDLEGEPDLALLPHNAAHIFATYFRETKCIDAANVQDWTRVRKLVNGGENQLSLFLSIITNLLRVNQLAG